MKKVISLMAVLFLLIFSGCSNTNNSNEVNLVITNIGFNGVFYPISENKIPQPEGITVNLVTASHTGAELFTITSDDNTVGILSYYNIAKLNEDGVKLKVLKPYYREIYNEEEGMSMGIVATQKGRNITSLKDIEGMTIGIQGETDGSTLLFKNSLRQNGVNLSKINFKIFDSEVLPILIQKGEIDGGMLESDYILDPSFNDKFEILVDFGKETHNLYGSVPPAKFFVVKKESYDKKPEMFDEVVKYFEDNYKWSVENQDEICKLESEQYHSDFDTLKRSYKFERRVDGLLPSDLEIYKELYKSYVEVGMLEKLPNVEELYE